ncbi:hypothetical protein, partial [Staphylococcus aureus]|uniref:hypothetical protein n=1 Tax=Staphylococcus aureus TaxID=1280 RepID=UPI001C9E518D
LFIRRPRVSTLPFSSPRSVVFRGQGGGYSLIVYFFFFRLCNFILVELGHNSSFAKFYLFSHPNLHLLLNFLFKLFLLGPLTLIEKSLLQVHFRSVNYY